MKLPSCEEHKDIKMAVRKKKSRATAGSRHYIQVSLLSSTQPNINSSNITSLIRGPQQRETRFSACMSEVSVRVREEGRMKTARKEGIKKGRKLGKGGEREKTEKKEGRERGRKGERK